ncbi:LacI family DNA-binding transcriptional regulator [Paenibacillus sedimenti]|uniref:LacI family DNA-binding transcriptional regulator n=1 Tax=Paenibacillus sedimenti TaxID=2770274 RepID=A0A926KUL1_9BACL|nr:LacI family DNA-binding transcriptional regulator [Paenibacillus sedimenti]MBD0383598.1 LacI family DNA-binding transcriptional regulator [Paenibacillus sedimenti]
MTKKNKVTMQEIADRVGVSKYAVSKALSGKPGISVVTREKIFELASQLGYLNQKVIKKIQNQTTSEQSDKIVCVLIPNIRSQNKESGYWGKILDGISKALESEGMGSIIVSDDSPKNFNLVMKPEGLLGVIGVGLIATPMLMELRSKAIPFIMVDHEDEMIESDSIFMNNIDIMRKMTNFLIGKGHKRIQFIGDLRYSRSFFDRWTGFRSIMDGHDLPYLRNHALQNVKPSLREENTNLLLSGLQSIPAGEFPTAIVCANDQIAVLAHKALAEMNLRVPEDCSLTGFDNNIDIIKDFPMLTTINAEKEALGIKAVDLLLWRLKNRQMPFEKILLQSDLIVRESISSVAES